jgi:2'-5' RNA ligase
MTSEAPPKRPNLKDTHGLLLPMDTLKPHITKVIERIWPGDLLFDEVIGHMHPIEEEPHVTVAIGLSDLDMKLFQILADFGSFDVVVHHLGHFSNAPREIEGEMRSFDVLYAKVDTDQSPRLLELHAKLAAVNKLEHKVYTPHITLAYMQYQTADKVIKELNGKFGPFKVHVSMVRFKPYRDPNKPDFYVKLPTRPAVTQTVVESSRKSEREDVRMSDA